MKLNVLSNDWFRDRKSSAALAATYSIKSPHLVKQLASTPLFKPSGVGGAGGGSGSGSGSMVAAPGTKHFRNGTNENHPVAVLNPNAVGPRRTYGGPRLLVNPAKVSPSSVAGSNSSLNSSNGGSALDLGILRSASATPSRMQVVRPPISIQDRPSFFTSGNHSEIW